MSPDQQAPQITETARFYTGARRIPVLLGKISGTRLPGGPYTITQLAIGSVVLFVGWNTRAIWGPLAGTGLTQVLVLALLTGGTVWGSGRIPTTRRRLPMLALDFVSSMNLPATGRFKGMPVRISRPHLVRGEVLIRATPGLALAATAAAAPAVDLVLDAVAVTPEPQLTPAPPAETGPDLDNEPELPDPLPSNVIPIRPTHATGVQRLLEQARQKESN